MPKSVTRHTLIASIIILFIVVISLYSLYMVREGGKEQQANQTVAIALQGENMVYTLTAGPGSFLSYNSSIYYYSENGTVINDFVSFNITIANYTWPLVEVNYTTSANKSGAASLLVGNVALPIEQLDDETVTIPLTIPFANDAICIKLLKIGEETIETGERRITVYVYEGNASLGDVVVHVLLSYNAENGLMTKSNITIYLKGRLMFRHTQILAQAVTTGTVKVSTGDSWICEPPLSSNAMLVWEGVYKVGEGPSLEPASINEVRAAMRKNSVVVILSKDGRNLTNVFWQRVLSLGQHSKVPCYVIVVGGMTTDDVNVFVKYLLDRIGVAEPVVAVRFQDGQVTAKAYSFAKPDELASIFDP